MLKLHFYKIHVQTIDTKLWKINVFVCLESYIIMYTFFFVIKIHCYLLKYLTLLVFKTPVLIESVKNIVNIGLENLQ